MCFLCWGAISGFWINNFMQRVRVGQIFLSVSGFGIGLEQQFAIDAKRSNGGLSVF